MSDNGSLESVRDFIAKHKVWIRKNLPNCGYGIAPPENRGGKPRIALRPQASTPAVDAKIEEFRQMAAAEGFELEVRVTGIIRPRR